MATGIRLIMLVHNEACVIVYTLEVAFMYVRMYVLAIGATHKN